MDPGPASERARRATVFGRTAQEYHRFRPSYPAAALDHLLPAGAARVLEIGAGTGKLTAALVARGCDVTAVEPDPGMLDVLRRELPGVRAVEAHAASLPVPDGSQDVVASADAWHWFPHDAAVAEVRRVLRPGGALGVLWSGPASDGSGLDELDALDPDRQGSRELPLLEGVPAAEVESSEYDWTWDVTPEDVRGLFGTHSGFVVASPDDRRRWSDGVAEVVEAARRRAGTARVPWRWTTVVRRWVPPV